MLKQRNRKKENRIDKKVCFAASSGGHYEQIMMLKPLMDKYNGFIVTEKTIYNTKDCGIKTYYLKQVNRKEIMVIPFMFLNVIKSLSIFIHEKPDLVVTTGVLSTIPICLIAKIFRRKIVYIESFAKISSPTMTGKLLYKFADQFYVQWEKMMEVYPKSIYRGGIY